MSSAYQQAYADWVNTFHLVEGVDDPENLTSEKMKVRIQAWENYVAVRDSKRSKNDQANRDRQSNPSFSVGKNS